jgi:hypothetical protein
MSSSLSSSEELLGDSVDSSVSSGDKSPVNTSQ